MTGSSANKPPPERGGGSRETHRRQLANVNGKQAGKQAGMGLEGRPGPPAQEARAIHQQHEIGHELGPPDDLPMSLLILCKTVVYQCVRQCERLSESETQPFASDRIDCA